MNADADVSLGGGSGLDADANVSVGRATGGSNLDADVDVSLADGDGIDAGATINLSGLRRTNALIRLDINGDGVLNAADDVNKDGIIDQADVKLAIRLGNAGTGTAADAKLDVTLGDGDGVDANANIRIGGLPKANALVKLDINGDGILNGRDDANGNGIIDEVDVSVAIGIGGGSGGSGGTGGSGGGRGGGNGGGNGNGAGPGAPIGGLAGMDPGTLRDTLGNLSKSDVMKFKRTCAEVMSSGRASKSELAVCQVVASL